MLTMRAAYAVDIRDMLHYIWQRRYAATRVISAREREEAGAAR